MRKLAIVVLVAACGGGSGGGQGTGPVTQAHAEEVCRADCEHDAACGAEPDVEGCVFNCADDFAGWARGDAVDILFDCFVALPCDDASDDQCLGLVQPLPIHEEWEAGCRSELVACLGPENIDAACEVSPDPANDEIGLFRFIAPEIMEEIIACLDEADCDARVDCVGGVFDKYGIHF